MFLGQKAATLLCAAGIGFAGAAGAQEVTLKVHHFLPPPSNPHQNFMVPWCDKIARESGGKLKCQLYPAMQLGGTPPQLYDQAKDGVADIVWTLPGYTAGRFPILEAFELPFMMTNSVSTSRALWEYAHQHASAEFKDVKALAFHVHGPGFIHMRDKQIRTLADFKGLKVRAPTRLTNKLIAAMGATPVGMPVPQVPEALNKGVIDGAVIPWEIVPGLKVQEIVKFHSETDPKFPAFYTSVFIYAMNIAKYNSLPADLKKVLDANSGIGLAEFIGKVFMDGDVPGRKSAEARNNTIIMIPASELENWRKAAQPVYDDWIKEMAAKGHDGRKLIESARSLIAKHTR
jgi:TRAP-type C4-dicarboxylate transport system substrate-binding protein